MAKLNMITLLQFRKQLHGISCSKGVVKYSIKDLERISGIKAHTIRIWEQRHNILNPTRSDTNIREYSPEDVRKIITLGSLNARGLKISKLAKLSEEDLAQEVLRHSENSQDVEFQVEQMVVAMVDFDIEEFKNILNQNIRLLGFEGAFEKLIYPFFERIGILWQVGSVDPVQEHLISNLIRHKIIVEIDRHTKSGDANNGKLLYAFLPEGEYHELGLLYYSLLAVKNGFKLLYFGQSTPFESFKDAIKFQAPDVVLMSFVQSMETQEMNDMIDYLASKHPEMHICVSGYQASKLDPDHPHCTLLADPEQFRTKMREILA